MSPGETGWFIISTYFFYLRLKNIKLSILHPKWSFSPFISSSAKQRQLKRARLADNLREKLKMRPGPIELIRAKILQPESDDGLVDAIETGAIQYQGTPGGQQLLHQV